MTDKKKRVGILISGRGSNMMSLIAAARAPDYPAEIACVLSNRPEAEGLFKAAGEGLPTRVIDHKHLRAREAFEAELDAALRSFGVDLVACAGFMRLMTPGFVERWHDRMLNIHPSLLPAFNGLDTHARALAAGVKVTGCTVHVVRPEVDSGPIMAQAAVPVLDGDTAESLAARVLEAEHLLYPHALALFASGRAILPGRKWWARKPRLTKKSSCFGPRCPEPGQPLLRPAPQRQNEAETRGRMDTCEPRMLRLQMVCMPCGDAGFEGLRHPPQACPLGPSLHPVGWIRHRQCV